MNPSIKNELEDLYNLCDLYMKYVIFLQEKIDKLENSKRVCKHCGQVDVPIDWADGC